MPSELSELIRTQASAIAAELASELQRSNVPHYQALTENLLHRRCEAVSAFVESCGGGDPGPFRDHVRRITEERLSEGFDLGEMQQALTILERQAWQVVVEDPNVAQLVRHLGIVTGTIGGAKDDLARAFFDGKRRAELAIQKLRLESLFEGTEGHVEAPDFEVGARDQGADR